MKCTYNRSLWFVEAYIFLFQFLQDTCNILLMKAFTLIDNESKQNTKVIIWKAHPHERGCRYIFLIDILLLKQKQILIVMKWCHVRWQTFSPNVTCSCSQNISNFLLPTWIANWDVSTPLHQRKHIVRRGQRMGSRNLLTKGFSNQVPLKLGMPRLLDKLSNLIKDRQYVNIKTSGRKGFIVCLEEHTYKNLEGISENEMLPTSIVWAFCFLKCHGIGIKLFAMIGVGSC